MTTYGWADVHALLRRMGELGTDLLEGVVDTLQRGDSAGADAIIERVRAMRTERVRVEELGGHLLNQAWPGTQQVRRAVATLQASQHLERVGQEVGALAAIVSSRGGHPLWEAPALAALSVGARARLRDAVESLLAMDIVRAQGVLAQQSHAEMHQRNLIESLLRRAADDPRSIGLDLTLLAVGRHLERVSELAGDIADLTVRNAESDSIGLV